MEELDAEPIPILEPSQFPSFARSAAGSSRPVPARPEPSDATSVDDEPTNPRIDTQVIFDVLDGRGVPAIEDVPTGEASPLSVHSALASKVPEHGVADRGVSGRGGPDSSLGRPSRDEAARLVTRLVSGESLTTAGRAQVLLALGRLLLRNGLLTAEELEDELRRG